MTRAIGVGSMDTDALLASANTGALDLLMVAGRYTLAEQPALAEVIPACRANGVGDRERLGLQLGPARHRQSRGRRALRIRWMFPHRCSSGCRLSRRSAGSSGSRCQPPRCSTRSATTPCASIVVGGSKPEQLAQNAARIGASIPDELWSTLAERGLIPA